VKTLQFKLISIIGYLFILFFLLLLTGCLGEENISIFHYYDYDHDFPLRDSLRLVENNERYDLYESVYYSVHESRVTGLLTIPKTGHAPYPVIIFLHGIKDDKNLHFHASFFNITCYCIKDVASILNRECPDLSSQHSWEFQKGAPQGASKIHQRRAWHTNALHLSSSRNKKTSDHWLKVCRVPLIPSNPAGSAGCAPGQKCLLPVTRKASKEVASFG